MKFKYRFKHALYMLHDYTWEFLFMRPMVALANWRMRRNGSNIHYRIYREKYGDHRPDDELI